MATIIDQTYFNNDATELVLPIDQIPTQTFIDKYEKKILKSLLGYSLYIEFITALAGTPAQKWIDLRDGGTYTDGSGDVQEYEGIQIIIADYVYFNILPARQSTATSNGVVISEKENAIITNPRQKQVFAYNDMVDRSFYLDEFIDAANDADDTTYENYLPTEQIKVNVLNI